MTDITSPVTPVLVAHVDKLERRRNRLIVTIAAIAAVVLVAVVTVGMDLVYSAAVDAHRTAEQTVGLQQTNHDLLLQVKADDAIIQADDAILKRATDGAAQQRSSDVVTGLEVCLLYRVGCPTDPTSTTTAPPAGPAPVAPAAAPPAPVAPRAAQPTTTTTTVPARPPITTRLGTAVDGAATCALALAYLATHQAPGFTDVCGPNAAAGPCAAFGIGADGHRVVGCTIARGPAGGPYTGTIYIDSTCSSIVPPENEAANSFILTGRRSGPTDPYGPAHCQ